MNSYSDGNWEDGIHDINGAKKDFFDMLKYLKICGAKFQKDNQVLDIGSGNGVFLNYLRTRGYSDSQIWGCFKKVGFSNALGLDKNPREKYGSNTIIKGNADNMPFGDGHFDLVTSTFLFDSTCYKGQNTQQILKEVFRVTRPGGFYVANQYREYDLVKNIVQELESQINTVLIGDNRHDFIPAQN